MERRQDCLCLLLLSLSLAAFCASTASAQVPDPVMSAQVPVPGSGHSYTGMGGEIVNPADGTLSFDLPIQTPPGRQASFPFAIQYHSEQFYLSGYTNSLGSTYPGLTWNPIPGASDWTYCVPVLTFLPSANGFYSVSGQGQTYVYHQCDSTGSVVFRGLDGVEHNVWGGASWSDPSLPPDPNFCPYSSGGTSVKEGIQVTEGTPPYPLWPGEPPLTVTDHSGTVYQFGASYVGSIGTTPALSTTALYPQTITDRNGNQLTFTANGTQDGYTDTLGREVVSWPVNSTPAQISIAGLSGSIAIYQSQVNATFPGQIIGTGHSGGGGYDCYKKSSQPAAGLYSQVSEIDIPGSPATQKYVFAYDQTYGRISKITFPGGGYVRYIWGLNPQSTQGSAQYYFYNNGYSTILGCSYNFDTPAITDRYVSYDGQTEVLHQHFSYSTSFSPWSKRTTVTNTDLLTSQSAITVYNYAAGATPGGSIWLSGAVPVETSILDKDGAGNILRTENKTWKTVRLLSGEQTILDNGQGSAIQHCYDLNEQITGVYEYGFQSEGSKPSDPICYYAANQPPLNNAAIGPLRRQTTTVYHVFSAGTNIVNSPDSITMADGSGNTVKQTTYTYTDTVQSSGAAVGLVAPPGANRGNIASITNLVSPGNTVTTSYTYFDTGQLKSMTDSCGNTTCADMTGTNHTTTYSYADNFAAGTPPGQTNAYLTQVTDPKGHTQGFSWGYNDGRLRSSIDQNGQTASYQYSDPLLRLTQVNRPDGGQTTIAYDDSTYNPSANTPSVTTTKKISSSLSQINITAMDGMGHAVRAILNSDPEGADTTDTTYDGFGRVRTQSNPHRSSASSTDGITTFNYDALGRVWNEGKPDGSSINRQFTGNCVTIWDEASKVHGECLDGLGRLTQLWEDQPGSNYPTFYNYDTLDNLTCVEQHAAPAAVRGVRLRPAMTPSVRGGLVKIEDSHANNIEQPDRLSAIQDKHDVEQMQDSSGTKVDYQSYVGAPNGDLIQFTPNSKAPDLLGDAKVVQKNVSPDPNPPRPPPPNCEHAGNCQK